MSNPKPVVVYAASGYTGRLACESLTRLRVPFVAAGRNQARLEEVAREMRAKGADCEARAVEHTPRGLRGLLRGAKVVVNISGPFSLLGHAVVDAALVEGCHYVDSTGEQDFMLDVRRDYGDSFERAKLVLSPSTAFLWGVGQVAAEVCLETPGIDSLRAVYAPPSLQTVASLQSMVRSARRPGYVISGGQLQLFPMGDVKKVPFPGEKDRKALLIGAGESTFFLGDPRVRACETRFANDDLARVAPVFKTWSQLSKVVSGDTLDRWSDALVLKLKKNPPAEDVESSAWVVHVVGTGGGREVRVTMKGTACYALTGSICAIAAQSLLDGKAQVFGYRSLGAAFGARHVVKRLEEFGTRMTVHGADQEKASTPGGGAARGAASSGGAHAH